MSLLVCAKHLDVNVSNPLLNESSVQCAQALPNLRKKSICKLMKQLFFIYFLIFMSSYKVVPKRQLNSVITGV